MKKNKILSVLLSLLIAICLWFFVVTVVTPEDSQWIYNIPVTFTNEDGLFSDRNLTLTEGRDATVSLRFSGKRQDLLKLNSTNISILVDLTRVTAPGDWSLSYEYELPDTVSGSDISVEGRSATTVDILVDKLDTKEVEVQADFVGDVASGYVQEPIMLEYETVEISGPKELVSRVDHAQVTLERTNLSKSVSDLLPVRLVDEDGETVESDDLRCSVDEIGVEMPVYMVKEVQLTATLIAGGGATEDHAICTIEPSSISVKGEPEALEALNSINLGTIDLATVQKKQTKEFDIVVPNGMQNLTTDGSAKVTVELRNLKTQTFTVTNIELANTPGSDYRVILGTTSLVVQIRGLDEEISEITASNIRAVADLSGLSSATGQYLVPVEIHVDGFSDVGAVGTYRVMVSIYESAEESTPVEVTEEPPTAGTGA